MASAQTTKPVEDTVSKIDNDIAVGADLEFQRKWWRFTRIMWIVFSIVVVADLLGCFGRGPLANAQIRASDGTFELKYERIERFSTPSMLRVEFGPSAIHQGKAQLWVSQSLIRSLGNQRVVPQPSESVLDGDGILYTFPVTNLPATVEFALEPVSPGIYHLKMRVPGSQEVNPRIIVMP
jgi:hypothetical protein